MSAPKAKKETPKAKRSSTGGKTEEKKRTSVKHGTRGSTAKKTGEATRTSVKHGTRKSKRG